MLCVPSPGHSVQPWAELHGAGRKSPPEHESHTDAGNTRTPVGGGLPAHAHSHHMIHVPGAVHIQRAL